MTYISVATGDGLPARSKPMNFSVVVVEMVIGAVGGEEDRRRLVGTQGDRLAGTEPATCWAGGHHRDQGIDGVRLGYHRRHVPDRIDSHELEGGRYGARRRGRGD